MDNSGKFWLMFWTIVGCTAVGITALITQNSARKVEANAEVIKKALDKGDDPMGAKCALLVGDALNISPQELAICMSVKKR